MGRSGLDNQNGAVMADTKALTTRAADFSAWYNEVIMRAELADYSPVRGCMVIRPNGYAIWEQMQRALDQMFKDTGHQNAYFPLFIPQSFLSREAEHVEGFAPETAVVTHGGGKELEEPLVVRPTSETIIYAMYAKWIQSYRDLPVLINQWANVVRWELRTRLFLRTTEFLWQEGHTAHATEAEAEAETRQMLGRVSDVHGGVDGDAGAHGPQDGQRAVRRRAPHLRLRGADAGRSGAPGGDEPQSGPELRQGVRGDVPATEGGLEYVWNTSWGVSTRLVGALIMTHSDDSGLVCPPRLAQYQVVIVPIYKTDDERTTVLDAAQRTRGLLTAAESGCMWMGGKASSPAPSTMNGKGGGCRSASRSARVTWPRHRRCWRAGPAARRSRCRWRAWPTACTTEMNRMQIELLEAARARREAASIRGATREQLIERMARRRRVRLRRLLRVGQCEAEIKEQTKATIRVLPDPEFRSPVAPAHLSLVRPGQRGRGRVGQGVLTPPGTVDVDGAAGRRRPRAPRGVAGHGGRFTDRRR